MASTRSYIKKNYMGAKLRRLIEDLNPGRPIIGGKLQVTGGHDYWWFLEYGTGIHYHIPEDERLKPPASARAEIAEGLYDIVAKNKPLLVYVTKAGNLRRAKATRHEGIQPLAIVRTSLMEAEIYLKEQVAGVKKPRKSKTWEHLPTRKELVELVNDVLNYLLLTLTMNTPEDSDPNPYHEGRHPEPLSQAWRVTKAR